MTGYSHKPDRLCSVTRQIGLAPQLPQLRFHQPLPSGVNTNPLNFLSHHFLLPSAVSGSQLLHHSRGSLTACLPCVIIPIISSPPSSLLPHISLYSSLSLAGQPVQLLMVFLQFQAQQVATNRRQKVDRISCAWFLRKD